MLENIINVLLPATLFITLQSILICWIVLKSICLSQQNFLTFLYITSEKSSTNARLLGGLSISISLICAIISMLIFYPKTLNNFETNSFIAALISIFLVTAYGYIDDKFEIRVRAKLSLQLLSVFSFAFFSAKHIFPQHTSIAFLLSSILGLALVNGTNLLDGLDTLSVKLGVITSLAFLYLGIIANSYGAIFLSCILISSLVIFYFFNRHPARVYMGEIGGGIIGLIYYFQSSLCFISFKVKMGNIQALSMVLIAGSLPICELGVSFFRRIYFKKSPFCGDRLHLHHVLKNKYTNTPGLTSSIMGISSGLAMAMAFYISTFSNPIYSLMLIISIITISYLAICISEWRENLCNHESSNLFKLFEGKRINIIDSTQFNNIHITTKEDTHDIKIA